MELFFQFTYKISYISNFSFNFFLVVIIIFFTFCTLHFILWNNLTYDAITKTAISNAPPNKLNKFSLTAAGGKMEEGQKLQRQIHSKVLNPEKRSVLW